MNVFKTKYKKKMIENLLQLSPNHPIFLADLTLTFLSSIIGGSLIFPKVFAAPGRAPSCAWELFPQLHTAPSESRKRLCALPQAIASIGGRFSRLFGRYKEQTLSPKPSCKFLLFPQLQAMPSSSRNTVCS